ncbi:MAG TPA: SDR family NAD(P)-dependent oxidoreductase, partial [Candidatus Binatia bacterium]|nr:SDR family NAD(P)-dependent oxidoreductase [Candidatus Binatia bacterium]
ERRVALVTGASSGIGRATAIDLARRGATVAICARRVDRLEETLRECQIHAPRSRAYPCDVRDREQIRATVARTRTDLGPIDILINNAGVGAYNLFTEAPEDEFEELMRANCFSAFYFTREVISSMVERQTGAVVFVSSFAGRVATWRHTAYSASKFAVTGLAEALYYEVKSRGVHVAVIYPGAIRTELFEKGPGFEHLRHVVEPQLLGPDVVTQAIAKAIERERFELFAPERYAIIWKLRALFPRAIVRGTLSFVRRHFERPGEPR